MNTNTKVQFAYGADPQPSLTDGMIYFNKSNKNIYLKTGTNTITYAEVGRKHGTTSEIFNDYSNNSANGDYSHAEGSNTTASGKSSHAEGASTIASGFASHAGGIGTQATAEAQTAIGKFNVINNDALFIVGNGESEYQKRNAFEVVNNGQIKTSMGIIPLLPLIPDSPNVTFGEIISNPIMIHFWKSYDLLNLFRNDFKAEGARDSQGYTLHQLEQNMLGYEMLLDSNNDIKFSVKTKYNIVNIQTEIIDIIKRTGCMNIYADTYWTATYDPDDNGSIASGTKFNISSIQFKYDVVNDRIYRFLRFADGSSVSGYSTLDNCLSRPFISYSQLYEM